MEKKFILVTGAAGFIGYSFIKRIIKEKKEKKDYVVIAVDNLNDYYDISLKEWRLKDLVASSVFDNWHFIKGDITDKSFISALFKEYKFSIVINLAAYAGVRYSITNPEGYVMTNILGFHNILEECRKCVGNGVFEKLIFASSSSVYGDNEEGPFSEKFNTDKPVSLYAASKKCDEVMGYSYAKLYGIKMIGLRFFTVYGPAGRPDMAYFKFTDSLKAGKKISLYNYGQCVRDFTYIDDLTSSLIKICDSRFVSHSDVPFEIYNIGNGNVYTLKEFVDTLIKVLLKTKVLDKFDYENDIEFLPAQPGDVVLTYADTFKLQNDYNCIFHTELEKGLASFARWYLMYKLL